jgi:conserved hypothetical protein
MIGLLTETKEKIEVLKKAEKADDKGIRFIQEIEKDFKNFNPYKVEMLLIHLLMVFERAKNNETVDTMPEELWQQITHKKSFSKANKYWKSIQDRVPYKINESEKQYVIMHLVNVISEGND